MAQIWRDFKLDCEDDRGFPMIGDELKAWRKMVGLSQQSAADVLGFGRRQYCNMENGFHDIRPCVDLACAAYALGIREYNGPAVAAVHARRKKERP